MANSIKYPFLELSKVNAPYRDELVEAVTRVIDSGYYIGGPEVEVLEKNMSGIVGVQNSVATSNGLDALRLIFRGYIEVGRLKQGDDILLPSATFIASALALTDCGLNPVFVDVSPETMNLDSAKLEQALTSRTRAVLVVHLYGHTCWDEKLVEFCHRNNLLIIEDAAQAIGARSGIAGINGTFCAGGLGHAGAFSFYPTKNVGALGDAGAVTTHDSELARVISSLRNYGSDGQYNNIYRGLNCRMDAVQAAMINVKLSHVAEENTLRIKQAAMYRNLINNPKVILPAHADDFGHVYHQFVVRVENRNAFIQHLERNGIATGIHYPVPVHKQPCYSQYGHLLLPETEKVCATCVSLPVSRSASQESIMATAQAVNSWH